MCLPSTCPRGGAGPGMGLISMSSSASLFWAEGAEVRPKEEPSNVLFICVCDQAGLPSSRVTASFPLVYFSHCKFLVQTQREKKLKKKSFVLKKKKCNGQRSCRGICLTSSLLAGCLPICDGILRTNLVESWALLDHTMSFEELEKPSHPVLCTEPCLRLGGDYSDTPTP